MTLKQYSRSLARPKHFITVETQARNKMSVEAQGKRMPIIKIQWTLWLEMPFKCVITYPKWQEETLAESWGDLIAKRLVREWWECWARAICGGSRWER